MRRATIYIYSRDEHRCVDWRFEGDRLIRDDPHERLRTYWEISQTRDHIDVWGTESENLAPPSGLGLAGTGLGKGTEFRIVRHEKTFIELVIVDSTDFNPALLTLEPCHWYFTRQACERSTQPDSCRM